MNNVGDIYEYDGCAIKITEIWEDRFNYEYASSNKRVWTKGEWCPIREWLQPDGKWAKCRVHEGRNPFALPNELFEV